MRHYFTSIFLLGISLPLDAQHTVNLKQAETIFLSRNLELLAAGLNLEQAKARVIQAAIWENPYVSAEFNVINPEGRSGQPKFLDVDYRGQKALSVQQLIHLGGKKNKEVALARSNAQYAEIYLREVLRNLKFKLRTTFFNIYYTELTAEALDRQILRLDSLVSAYKLQAAKGNVSLREVVRLQSLFLEFKNVQTELINQITEEKGMLQTLLSIDSSIIPKPENDEILVYEKTLNRSLDMLLEDALQNRSDLHLAERRIEESKLNLLWQKALAIPDITIGINYDQRGGAFTNQLNMTASLPLRLWNSNKGNIQSAEIAVKQSLTHLELQRVELRNEVSSSIKKYEKIRADYLLLKASISEDLDQVLIGVLNNFQKSNISMLEFTDFMESYSQSMISLNNLRKSLVRFAEELNFVTGTQLF